MKDGSRISLKFGKNEVKCSSFRDHTPCPEGYIQWHTWADRMAKTHTQVRCASCGLWAIWIPKPGNGQLIEKP